MYEYTTQALIEFVVASCVGGIIVATISYYIFANLIIKEMPNAITRITEQLKNEIENLKQTIKEIKNDQETYYKNYVISLQQEINTSEKQIKNLNNEIIKLKQMHKRQIKKAENVTIQKSKGESNV